MVAGRSPEAIVWSPKHRRWGGKNSGPALVPRDDAPSEAYIDKYEQRVVPAAGVAPPDRAQMTQILCALRGFTAHEFRHFAFQLASRAGELWNEEHQSTGAAVLPAPTAYAHALLDHANIGHDRLAAVYGDLSYDAAYELLSGRAIELMWQLLTTDLGEEKRPDVDAYSDRLAELRACANLSWPRSSGDRAGSSVTPAAIPTSLCFPVLRCPTAASCT